MSKETSPAVRLLPAPWIRLEVAGKVVVKIPPGHLLEVRLGGIPHTCDLAEGPEQVFHNGSWDLRMVPHPAREYFPHCGEECCNGREL